MKIRCVILMLCLVGMGVNTKAWQDSTQTAVYYDLGKAKLEAGEWQIALSVWLQGIKHSQKQEKKDPRLGFSIIHTATEYQAVDYYSIASNAYFWSLDEDYFDEFYDAYKAEVNRLLPLLEDKTKRRLKQKLRSRDATVLTDIQAFWDEEDLVLSTPVNERLIEHWERVAYAKRNFNRHENTPYGTDDRGSLYVRYGAPTKVFTGSLTFNPVLARSKASELIDVIKDGASNIADTSSSFFASPFIATLQSDVLVENIVRAARDYHRFSQYVIWIYERFDTQFDEKVVFIFGEDGDTGLFGMRKSVEEMIPSRAFGVRADQSRTTGVPVSAGLILQLMVYAQLSPYDAFFNDRLLDLESKVFSKAKMNSSYVDITAKNENEFQLNRIQAQLPNEESSLTEGIPEIEVNTRQYRLLDADNNPVLLVAAFSDPYNALFTDYLKKRKISESMKAADLRLLHSLKFIRDGYEADSVKSDTVNINLTTEPSGPKLAKSRTIFKVPNIQGAKNVVSGELYNIKPSSVRSILPDEIIGLGMAKQAHPEPLNTRENELEMGDLILGHSKSEGDYFLPFIIEEENSIPQNKNLIVHFEVYHLQKNTDGVAQFEVEYKVRSPRKGLGRIFGAKSNDLSLKLFFDTNETYFREDLEIEVAQFTPGQYELILKSTDLNREGETIERKVDFTILGSKEN